MSRKSDTSVSEQLAADKERAERAEAELLKMTDERDEWKKLLYGEQERADRLQARIDAALVWAEENRDDDAHEGAYTPYLVPILTGSSDALTEDQPAPEDHSSHEFCDRRLGCVVSEPTPQPTEKPHLDPEAWIGFTGERYSTTLAALLAEPTFAPRERDENGKPYSQNREDYT